MVNTITPERLDFDRWASKSSSYNQSSSSLLKPNRLPNRDARRYWLVITFGLITLASLMMVVGIIVITFLIHPSTTTTTTTSTSESPYSMKII
jgi:hypothetical protein